jgi:hypothetical protein
LVCSSSPCSGHTRCADQRETQRRQGTDLGRAAYTAAARAAGAPESEWRCVRLSARASERDPSRPENELSFRMYWAN